MFAARLTSFLRIVFIAATLAVAACQTAPVQEMSDARQAIAVAREAGASQYAPEDLRAAEGHLDSALRNLSRKAYDLARADAVEAKNRALSALAGAERAAPARHHHVLVHEVLHRGSVSRLQVF